MPSALLPPGFYDLLPPDAARQARLAESLMRCFGDAGYARVDAPLMEYEDTLLSGPGAALNAATFRVMDSTGPRMLGIRTDHTLQIGRIAAARLGGAPRPLRLSYAGPAITAAPGGASPARQKLQVGVELIGGRDAKADAEVIALAAAALAALGVTGVCVDLLLPTLVASLAEAVGIGAEEADRLHPALDRKDEGAVRALAASGGSFGKLCETCLELLAAGGEAGKALEALERLDLPEKARTDRARLKEVLALLPREGIARLSVDLCERRCFEYQTGLSFSLFSPAASGVLGRGGRYRTQGGEPATGFTFYAENLVSLCPDEKERPRVLAPFDLPAAEASRLKQEGHVVLRAHTDDLLKEAKEQGCGFVWDGELKPAVPRGHSD